MRKSLLLLLTIGMLFTLNACSDDEKDKLPDNGGTPTIALNIPKWLQGKWGQEIKDINDEIIKTNPAFEITNNTMHTIALNTSTDVLLGMTQGNGIKVEEPINNNNEYQLKITIVSVTTTYHFKKIDDNKIIWLTGGTLPDFELVRM